MTRFFTRSTTGAVLAVAIALSAPAHAQLLGGGLGGGLGGALGGGFPIGSIGSTGSVGATGSVDSATRSVRASARASRDANAATRAASSSLRTSQAANAVVRVPAVAVPGVRAGALAVPAVKLAPVVRSVIVVPAIPDLGVRRTAIIEAGIAPITYAEVPAYVDHQYVVLQDELRGTGVHVRKQGRQIVLDMPSDVTFAFNKYDIQPRFYSVLSAVSRTLAHFPATYVDVNGHTDAIGSYSYNQVLSEKRADTVADFLAARQVNPVRMHVEGFGKTEPIASNATIEGRSANRRVEIILTPYAT
jgi:outer membrane protein OmpA-like peptidoglycan-associated protein